ncbi:MAG TPA: bifunctional riboflavin kinase/FAD synthetase [bacterium]|nr:bifunctional riboflavin kinase/FAD synthetase [bacterium]
MRTARGLAEVPVDLTSPVLALGTFDGIHLGHRQVIGAALARARAIGGTAVIVTFDPHPVEVLRPSSDPVLLTTLDERLGLLADAGVDVTVVLPFDLEFSRISAQAWLDEILAERLRVREIVAGSSYTFGYRREGTAARLAAWGSAAGVAVHLLPAVLVSGEPVSSSRIRSALREGLVDEATRLLGRWYSLRGPVVRGDGRGRTIGVPTANLLPPARKVLPALGVYATVVDAGGRGYGGATNVGRRPTFGGGAVAVETHLLGFDGDLSGQEVTLSFVQQIREERAFPGVEALVRQIRADVDRVRELLAAVGPGIIR